jgi:hydrogenase-4 membrane subunit HyfE
MQCTNHPSIPAVDRCAGCAEPFCNNCLVEIQGQKYCASCKTMAVQGKPVVIESATLPCKEANEALKYAIIGIFCFGIILEPIAIKKALEAKKMIEMNPRLTGSGKATAALVIAVVGLILWVLGIIARIGGNA